MAVEAVETSADCFIFFNKLQLKLLDQSIVQLSPTDCCTTTDKIIQQILAHQIVTIEWRVTHTS